MHILTTTCLLLRCGADGIFKDGAAHVTTFCLANSFQSVLSSCNYRTLFIFPWLFRITLHRIASLLFIQVVHRKVVYYSSRISQLTTINRTPKEQVSYMVEISHKIKCFEKLHIITESEKCKWNWLRDSIWEIPIFCHVENADRNSFTWSDVWKYISNIN